MANILTTTPSDTLHFSLLQWSGYAMWKGHDERVGTDMAPRIQQMLLDQYERERLEAKHADT